MYEVFHYNRSALVRFTHICCKGFRELSLIPYGGNERYAASFQHVRLLAHAY